MLILPTRGEIKEPIANLLVQYLGARIYANLTSLNPCILREMKNMAILMLDGEVTSPPLSS